MGRRKKDGTEPPKKYKPIRMSWWVKQIGIYMILSPPPDQYALGRIHVSYARENHIRIDVYEGEKLIHQYLGETEPWPFGNALNGLCFGGIQLYKEGVTVSPDYLSIAGKERDTYIPGLNRLKALGYEIINVL